MLLLLNMFIHELFTVSFIRYKTSEIMYKVFLVIYIM